MKEETYLFGKNEGKTKRETNEQPKCMHDVAQYDIIYIYVGV